jgi:hypothetical protein
MKSRRTGWEIIYIKPMSANWLNTGKDCSSKEIWIHNCLETNY